MAENTVLHRCLPSPYLSREYLLVCEHLADKRVTGKRLLKPVLSVDIAKLIWQNRRDFVSFLEQKWIAAQNHTAKDGSLATQSWLESEDRRDL